MIKVNLISCCPTFEVHFIITYLFILKGLPIHYFILFQGFLKQWGGLSDIGDVV